MADREERNPYAAANTTALQSARRSDPSLLKGLFIVLSAYYVGSMLTLPFADEIWFGELPVFAIWQLPKCYAFDFVRGCLMSLMRAFGLSSGSPSPDMIASKPWAFAVLFLTPSALLVGVACAFRRAKQLRGWIGILLIAASIDAAVTVWFELSSSLSIF